METEILFTGKRIDNGEEVKGYYFISPLTDENSGTDSSCGWFFLSGEIRHCISSNLGNGGVVYVVDPESVECETYNKIRAILDDFMNLTDKLINHSTNLERSIDELTN